MTIIAASEKIKHNVQDGIFVIQLDDAKSLNSMTGHDYLYLGHLMEIADRDSAVYLTVLQSSGRFFSSGANVGNIGAMQSAQDENGELGKWLSEFVSRNLFVTHVFAKHTKPIVCCLNGPAVGLSAAIVMLCDVVYAMNNSVYLLFPFANLALVTEGALSVTLPMKLGYNVASEILTLARPVTFDQLNGKVVTRNYNLKDTQEFNSQVLQDLKRATGDLHKESIPGMKRLLQRSVLDQMKRANVDEVNDALSYWVRGLPQQRFREIKSKQRIHKM
ncbi:LAMI_0C06172g1_1 [Lachancea mirantina]|uniref:LAMI_0C06172g1_1 n=1 Tax=Lachancea mirantina TaxID=1230905 RepID=A0A1G4J3D5_9SACH|nr:LAMI_0C06172g1_1 [Lachancea mirantina]